MIRFVVILLWPFGFYFASLHEVLMEIQQDTHSDSQVLAISEYRSVFACVMKCCKRRDCAALNIKDDMCQLLPPSVNALNTSLGSTYYWNKYYGMTFDPSLDTWYSAVSQDRATWYKALKICVSRGQQLIRIRDQQTQNKLMAIAAGQNTWLGMRRDSTGLNEYVYSGDGLPLTYTNWYTDQPDLLPITSDTNCLAAYKNYQHQWFDAPCSVEKPYMCEIKN